MDGLTPYIEALQSFLSYPSDPSKRVYGVYILGTLGILLLMALWQRLRPSGPGERNALQVFFNPRVWTHPSARLDYQLVVINPLIQTFFAGLASLSLVPVALQVSDSLSVLLGSVSLEWPRARVTLAFTLALFVADDFSRFLLHYLMHKVPWLWSIHRLHHSAEVLTPLTVYRIHPIESLLYSLRMVLAQGLVLGLFFFAFGMRLSAWEIAGANLFTYAFNFAGSNLRHSHVWLSFGPWLERIFISPAQHQIHHSNAPRHFDRNMGSFLSVWDGLFGTLTPARGETVTGFGLRQNQPSPHTHLLNAYGEPVLDLGRQMVRFYPVRPVEKGTPSLSGQNSEVSANEVANYYH